MKKIITLLLAAIAFSCTEEKVAEITITNPGSLDRTNEIVEVSMDALAKFNGESFIIPGVMGKQTPYQITHDNKLIFQVTVPAHQSISFKLVPGTPDSYPVIACGKHYPERVDDIAWENDCIAFRMYGPALQATGEQAFGCDVWVKRVPEPVVEQRYATELNPESRAKIEELKKTDKAVAEELENSISYHIDHGNGLDYYKVGPTLGAGASALLVDGNIVYPYCFSTYKILDNGPLRFTVEATYNPLAIKEDDLVTETRVITLNAGSQLNKFTLSYANLSEATEVATGIVIHEPSNDYVADAQAGYIAYAEPVEEPNGQTFVGAVFPAAVNEAKAVYFSNKEKAERGAEGHVLGISTYNPGSTYTYYAGAGWSKWGFTDSAEWFEYVKDFAQKIKEPLQVTVK
ncbi:MAG: DUF4861 domain-containing protein [Tannerellaceae bacterium]|nr:DUF4861 domain-containing protein [Tannerellaceae bacterium]